LPKVELHIHLDGSFDPPLLWEAAQRNREALPEEVQSAVTGKPMPVRSEVDNCRNLEDFRRLIVCKGKGSLQAMLDCLSRFLPAVRGDLKTLEEIGARFVAAQAAQGIVYTEVRYSPHLLTGGDIFGPGQVVDPEPAFAAVTRGLRKGCKAHGVVVNQIICCISFQPAWSLQCVEMAAKHRKDFPCAVVGVDVAAGEVGDDPKGHEDAFALAKELGLKITVHAGEVGGPENVRHAVFDFGAHRIGHGYAMTRDAPGLAEIVREGAHFEVCPTSSLETGAWTSKEGVPNWPQHPLLTMLEAGAKVSINSDDPTVFDTSLSEELLLCIRKMKLTREQVVQMTLSAVESAFGDDEELTRIRQRIEQFAANGSA